MKKTSFLRSEDRQRFSLRKLSIGVTSVLIGTSFMVFGSQQAHADELNNSDQNSEVVTEQKASDQQVNDNASQDNDTKVAEDVDVNTTTENQDGKESNQTQALQNQKNDSKEQEQQKQVNTNTFKIANVNTVNKNAAESLAESKLAQTPRDYAQRVYGQRTNGYQESENNTNNTNNVNQKAQKSQPTVQYKNPEEVYDWNGFTNALRDKNVDAIVLDNDIYAYGPRETALNGRQDWDISRTVTITSKDPNHRNTINFGNHFISFWDQNHRWYQDNNTPWNIVVKDVNITNTDSVFSPFFFNNESVREANKDKITFDNVDQNGDMLLRSEQVNAEFKNNVNINSHLHNGDYSAIYAHSVKIDPNANVNINVSDDTYCQYLMGNAAIHIVDTNNGVGVEVGENATLRINPDGKVYNTKGIITTGANDVILDRGAKVEMNLGRGNSTGIFGAQNLILNDGSSLLIDTAEDNNGVVAWGANNNGHHVSPITLGYNRACNSSSTLDIKNGASLKIVRADGCPSIDGLISFGGTGMNPRNQFNLNVEDGATLDLQDAAHSNWHAYGTNLAEYLGNSNYLYNTGMISMYGNDSEDHVNFGNVKYVNLQRTGYQHGILMRLEGGSSIGSNSITIRGKNMPLSQWVAGNYGDKADYTWNIDELNTQNKFGDFSYNYNARGQRTYVAPSYNQRYYCVDFADANANVEFTDGSSLYSHPDFNYGFNWWSPQRISFGSALVPETIYSARVSDADALNTHVGATTSVPSLDPHSIHFTWTDQNGQIVDAPQNYDVEWTTSPDTSRATVVGEPDRQGEVMVTVNKHSFYVKVPVNVYSAKTQHDGYKIHQNDAANMPSAGYMTDTSDVDRFGVRDVNWVTEPDISNPGAEVYGRTRVDYDDGTSQYLNPYVDVIGVEDGRDHKDDINLYRSFRYYQEYTDFNGQHHRVMVTKHRARTRYTDYAYPVGDSRRVTYSDWTTLD